VYLSLSGFPFFSVRLFIKCILHPKKPWFAVSFSTGSIEPSDVVAKSVAGAKSCNLATDSCKFPTEAIADAQNFNLLLKFDQNGAF